MFIRLENVLNKIAERIRVNHSVIDVIPIEINFFLLNDKDIPIRNPKIIIKGMDIFMKKGIIKI